MGRGVGSTPATSAGAADALSAVLQRTGAGSAATPAGAGVAGGAEAAGGEASGAGTGAGVESETLRLVGQQRERARRHGEELEAECARLKERLGAGGEEARRLHNDNLRLYEKVRTLTTLASHYNDERLMTRCVSLICAFTRRCASSNRDLAARVVVQARAQARARALRGARVRSPSPSPSRRRRGVIARRTRSRSAPFAAFSWKDDVSSLVTHDSLQVNPFAAFSRKERQLRYAALPSWCTPDTCQSMSIAARHHTCRYAALSPAEKLVHSFSSFFLANKHARLFLLAYVSRPRFT